MEQKKICSKCKKEKNLNEFHNHKNEKFGKHHYCKLCNSKQKKIRYHGDEDYRRYLKNNSYKRKYNITLDDAEQMLMEQGGVCKICKKEIYFDNKQTHVDHCHDSGVVRGILCQNCNTFMGIINEDIEKLKRMIKYIETMGSLC